MMPSEAATTSELPAMIGAKYEKASPVGVASTIGMPVPSSKSSETEFVLEPSAPWCVAVPEMAPVTMLGSNGRLKPTLAGWLSLTVSGRAW
jgi:hypothetical protein